MGDRLGELEMLNRVRNLTPDESDELADIITAEKRRTWYRQSSTAADRRTRYALDPEYRTRILAKNERYRLRKAGRA